MSNNYEALSPYITNLESDVFCLKNLPEVVKGALFSRYSRSEKGLKQTLLEEFLNEPEALFGEAIGSDDLVDIQKAEAFYDRVLGEYNDESIAELGGAHIACERISNIAAKELEDSRLGISPLEKSSRYVRFDIKEDGKYPYYREQTICSSSFSNLYEETLDRLFDTYSQLIEPLSEYLKTQNPKDEETTDRAYRISIKAKALDILRGLLPMATLTNVGLYGNGRGLEYLLVKLNGSQFIETRELGCRMLDELMKVIPSFVKKAVSDRGLHQSGRLALRNSTIAQIAKKYLRTSDERDNWADDRSNGVALIEREEPEIAKTTILAAILYPCDTRHFGILQSFAYSYPAFSEEDKAAVIRAYLGNRKSRFDKVGRAFEEVYYTFDILADIGAYRDLQRHRVLSQEHQDYTTQHGYDVPRELIAAELDKEYCHALDKTEKAYNEIARRFPTEAQYLVPFAFKVRWKIKMNLREAYHFIELRSGRQGHPSYRKIAQEMYLEIKKVHPLLAEGMLVDMNDYDLERLAAEQKNDKRRGMV